MKILHVSNRLPIIMRDSEISKGHGGLAAALDSMRAQENTLWIGWPGAEVVDSDRKNVYESLVRDFKCVPVFVNQEDQVGYYDGFSNSSLWPILHYMPEYMEYNDSWFDNYTAVNYKFAEEVISNAGDDDIVWIHDYHLMLLPEMIKQQRPELKVGFFLHTPFPSYELFRCHPKRQELLFGMLGADLIGFHTFGYLRHFRSALLRILGIESHLNQVLYQGYEKKLGVFPIGIDAQRFESVMLTEFFLEHQAALDEQYSDKKVVLSVERLDYSKGIPKKLQAIEKFLQNYPEKREDTVFILIAVPSREEVESYRLLKETVELAVGRINGQFATVHNIPINFINRSVPFDELAALYAIADVALVTPLVDGMNLVAKEYVACQIDGDGALILSEFAGVAQELFSAILVNPYDVDEVSRSIAFALEMDVSARRSRMIPMRKRVLQYDAVHWAEEFIGVLSKPLERTEVIADYEMLLKKILEDFSLNNDTKYLFLDYDGTLREFERNPEDAGPNEQLRSVLSALSSRKDFDVHIVSGRDTLFLDKHFSEWNFTLIAEHGYMMRSPSSSWALVNDEADLSWKDEVEKIFQLYALSTPGSAVEVKHSSIVWHYRKADPEFGIWKANHLMGELTESISNLPVEIHHGKRIVEVSSQLISKGGAVEKILREKENTALVLCMGDDQTDETMLQIKRDSFYTIKVGEGPTSAGYRISNPRRVREFLSEIAKA